MQNYAPIGFLYSYIKKSAQLFRDGVLSSKGELNDNEVQVSDVSLLLIIDHQSPRAKFDYD